MACRLFGTKPLSEAHIFNWAIGGKLQWNFDRNSNIFIHENSFENISCNVEAMLLCDKTRLWRNNDVFTH